MPAMGLIIRATIFAKRGIKMKRVDYVAIFIQEKISVLLSQDGEIFVHKRIMSIQIYF